MFVSWAGLSFALVRHSLNSYCGSATAGWPLGGASISGGVKLDPMRGNCWPTKFVLGVINFSPVSTGRDGSVYEGGNNFFSSIGSWG